MRLTRVTLFLTELELELTKMSSVPFFIIAATQFLGGTSAGHSFPFIRDPCLTGVGGREAWDTSNA